MRTLAAAGAILTGLSLALPAAAQWVRPEGQQRSAIRRGEPARRAPTPGMLPNLHKFCELKGWTRAELRGDEWRCATGERSTPIDLDNVCRVDDFRGVGLVAFQVTPGDPYSWQCHTRESIDRQNARRGAADMGERTASADSGMAAEGYDAGVAPTSSAAAPSGTEAAPGAPPGPAAPGAAPAAAPGIMPPATTPADASAVEVPQTLMESVTAPWTNLPFYARAIIAGLGALVLGLLAGTMLRRKPGKED